MLRVAVYTILEGFQPFPPEQVSEEKLLEFGGVGCVLVLGASRGLLGGLASIHWGKETRTHQNHQIPPDPARLYQTPQDLTRLTRNHQTLPDSTRPDQTPPEPIVTLLYVRACTQH
jgi:hypothetical protein